MGFFSSGMNWSTNPGLEGALGALQGAYDDTSGMKTGSKWLKAFNRGDFSGIGNPFAQQAAAAHRLNASNQDPFLPPEIASARTQLANDRADESAGQNFQNYASSALQNAFNQKQENRRFRTSQLNGLAGQMADANLGGHQGYQTQSVFSQLIGPALGAAMAFGTGGASAAPPSIGALGGSFGSGMAGATQAPFRMPGF